MSYNSISFIIALLAIVVAYYALPRRFQWGVLLCASMGLYAGACKGGIVYLIADAAVIYISGRVLEKLDNECKARREAADKSARKLIKKKFESYKKLCVLVTTVISAGMILGTKYLNFIFSLINSAADVSGVSHHGLPLMSVLIPLGISYYTLMGISYVVDVYRGVATAERNPFMLMLYLAYFPHIVQGPFDRYNDVCQQFREEHAISYEMIQTGMVRFAWGMVKKIVIADRLGMAVISLFAADKGTNGTYMLVGAVLYTIQLYADFSGCMDMALGASKMFGIDIAENFRRPFLSKSISEFWRRWHITLGAWLKDYVLYPMSLSGHVKKMGAWTRAHVRNKYFAAALPTMYALFYVWFITGLWHGASVKYICYGLYYYLLMMIGLIIKPVADKSLSMLKISRDSLGYRVFEVIRTNIIVCIGMLLFRSENLMVFFRYLKTIIIDFSFSELFSGRFLNIGIDVYDYVIVAVFMLAWLLVSIMQEKDIDIAGKIRGQYLPVRWALYVCVIYSVILFGAYGGGFADMSFIYAEF